MTIKADLDAALAAWDQPGRRRFRMGEPALRALAAEGCCPVDADGLPLSYAGVAIERVDSPRQPFDKGSADIFSGWELIA